MSNVPPMMVSAIGERPHRRLALLGLALTPAALVLGLTLAPGGAVYTVMVLAVGFPLASRAMALQYDHHVLGACNVTTAIRLGLTAALAAVIAGVASDTAAWAVFALATIVLVLDGVDGWLARRRALSSEFGARFDMEVDAALAGILALIAVSAGRGGAELIVLGGARYIFVAAGLALPWLNGPLDESLRRKIICVLQIGALVAMTLPIMSDGTARAIGVPAALLVVWSFARDIRTLRSRTWV